ncbi:MAG: ComEC family competence protein, partial [Deltaproteobacteria bacterium]
GQIALEIMRPSLWWVLKVAETVAAQDHPVELVVTPPMFVVPMIALGGLFLSLWQGRFRVRACGLVPVVLAFFIWSQATRPALLIAPDGPLAGLITEHGRALNKAKGQGFAAETWLENDGDGATQDEAAARPASLSADYDRYDVNGVKIAVLTGKKKAALLEIACAEADFVVMSEPRPRGFAGPCRVLGKWQLRDTGALAFWPVENGVRVEQTQGRSFRPWD